MNAIFTHTSTILVWALGEGSSTMRGSMNKLVFIKSKVSEGWCIAINPSDLISIMFYSRFNLWTNQQFYDAPVATYTGLLLLQIF